MNETIEEYRELVRKLKALLDDPHPGLSSWCLMFGATMNSLMELWMPEAEIDTSPREPVTTSPA